MRVLISVVLFFLCNLIGSLIGPLLYVLSVKYELVAANEGLDQTIFFNDIVLLVSLTWLVCALFSFATFFLSGIWRVVFYLAPIVIPLIVGLVTLAGYIQS